MNLKALPALGLIGPIALREAFNGDYRQLEELLRGALKALFKLTGDEDPWPYVRALFPETVVVERDGKLLRYPYTVNGTDVTLGEPVEVVQSYVPAGGAMREAAGLFIEALPKAGTAPSARYRVRVIRAGMSGNMNFYPAAVLREAVPLFDGVRVFVKSDEEHIAGKGKDFRNLVGRLVEPTFIEGKGDDTGELQAVLELLEPEGTVATKLREAWDRNMTSLFGLSIDATGPAKQRTHQGRTFREAQAIRTVKSVDLIVEPGAGGEVISLIEALNEEDDMLRTRIISLIEAKRPDLLTGKDVAKLDDAALETIFAEAMKEPAAAAPAGVTKSDLDKTVRLVEARANMRSRIDLSKLPEKAKAKLRKQFEADESFTEAQVDQAIKDELEYLADFTESGTVRGLGENFRIESGETRQAKITRMLDAFFDPTHKDHRQAQSFKEAYIEITGDKRVTGQLRDCDQASMREALGTGDLANVLGDSITRRMVADYRQENQYDIWRRIATVAPAGDFRTQERTRVGGYGDLPAVTQGAPYAPLTSPTDEKATYAVGKKGGTEEITLEAIKNDDVGLIRRIPVKMSRAAKRTLAKFALDFIRVNPTVYDGLALFHATHGNLGSAALDAASLAARRIAMLKQTELGSADRIGIGPRSLLVPADLENAAVDLFRRNTNQDKTFIQSLSLDVLPVWYWTDTNDWALAADILDIPGIEIGFLDGNEEPELFVQDSPIVGSMFSHDKLTYKIRHIYGGNVLDFRAFDKSVVA